MTFRECKVELMRCGPSRPWHQFSWSPAEEYQRRLRSARSWEALREVMRDATWTPADVRNVVLTRAEQ